MATCPFTNRGGPGSKAAPCGRDSCEHWVDLVSMCCFKLMAIEMRALRLLNEEADTPYPDNQADADEARALNGGA